MTTDGGCAIAIGTACNVGGTVQMRRGIVGIALVAALSLAAGCGGKASGNAPHFQSGTG